MTEENDVRVMIVEDDPTVLTVTADYLRAAGHQVTRFADGASALAELRARIPHVLVLDRMLPMMSGDELCRAARDISSQLPIIMLTALDAPEERVRGLEYGADDYVAKPFVLRELLLRVNAIVRRTQGSRSTSAALEIGPFRVEPGRRRVSFDKREITLTPREYELLYFLLQNPGRLVTRDEILREVWGWTVGDVSTVTVHVRRLREKIEPEPRVPCFLLTEWGAGYRLSVEASGGC